MPLTISTFINNARMLIAVVHWISLTLTECCNALVQHFESLFYSMSIVSSSTGTSMSNSQLRIATTSPIIPDSPG